MFSGISLGLIALTIALMVAHHIAFPISRRSERFTPACLLRKAIHLLTLIFLEQKLGFLGRVRKLAFLLALAAFVVLLITGFIPMWLGGHIGGYWLMLHVVAAAAFAIGAAVVAVLAAKEYAFSRQDLSQIAALWRQRKQRRVCVIADSQLTVKICFWLLLPLAAALALTMAFSMTPLFGTDGQRILLMLHRLAALAFSLVALTGLYCLIRQLVRKDKDNDTFFC